jgi:hypothetical protein
MGCEMLPRFFQSIPFLLIALASTTSASIGQECDPRAFLVSEIEKLNSSSQVAVAAYENLEESNIQTRDKKFNGGAIISGAPVELSFSDAKKVAQFTKNNYGFTKSLSHELSYLKIALSATGAAAYKTCVENRSRTVVVDIPDAAFSDQSFMMKVKWSPKAAGLPDSTQAKIELLNGSIDGKATHEVSVTKQESFPARVKRSFCKPLTISVSILGDTELIYLPALWQPEATAEFKTVSGSVHMSAPQNRRDKAETEVCVTPSSPNSILLLSTATNTNVKQSGNPQHTRISNPYQKGLAVCSKLFADAAGADTHEWGISATLQVTELSKKSIQCKELDS